MVESSNQLPLLRLNQQHLRNQPQVASSTTEHSDQTGEKYTCCAGASFLSPREYQPTSDGMVSVASQRVLLDQVSPAIGNVGLASGNLLEPIGSPIKTAITSDRDTIIPQPQPPVAQNYIAIMPHPLQFNHSQPQSQIAKSYRPDTVIEEEHSINGLPVVTASQALDNDEQQIPKIDDEARSINITYPKESFPAENNILNDFEQIRIRAGEVIGPSTTVLPFEQALMVLDYKQKIQHPCPRKTLNFGPKRVMGFHNNPLAHHYATQKQIKYTVFNTRSKKDIEDSSNCFQGISRTKSNRVESTASIGTLSNPTACTSRKVLGLRSIVRKERSKKRIASTSPTDTEQRATEFHDKNQVDDKQLTTQVDSNQGRDEAVLIYTETARSNTGFVASIMSEPSQNVQQPIPEFNTPYQGTNCENQQADTTQQQQASIQAVSTHAGISLNTISTSKIRPSTVGKEPICFEQKDQFQRTAATISSIKRTEGSRRRAIHDNGQKKEKKLIKQLQSGSHHSSSAVTMSPTRSRFSQQQIQLAKTGMYMGEINTIDNHALNNTSTGKLKSGMPRPARGGFTLSAQLELARSHINQAMTMKSDTFCGTRKLSNAQSLSQQKHSIRVTRPGSARRGHRGLSAAQSQHRNIVRISSKALSRMQQTKNAFKF